MAQNEVCRSMRGQSPLSKVRMLLVLPVRMPVRGLSPHGKCMEGVRAQMRGLSPHFMHRRCNDAGTGTGDWLAGDARLPH